MAVGFLNAISDPWNAGIFVFLVMLGIMVALVNKAGWIGGFRCLGGQAYQDARRRAARHLRARRCSSSSMTTSTVLPWVRSCVP